jgi:NADH:ubiquinone oxidoreductase subunit 4 (subunit M)
MLELKYLLVSNIIVPLIGFFLVMFIPKKKTKLLQKVGILFSFLSLLLCVIFLFFFNKKADAYVYILIFDSWHIVVFLYTKVTFVFLVFFFLITLLIFLIIVFISAEIKTKLKKTLRILFLLEFLTITFVCYYSIGMGTF